MPVERIGPAELLELAGQRHRRDIRIEPSALPRLANVLMHGSAIADQPLSASVRFQLGPERFPELMLRIEGAVELVCQRCLGALARRVDIECRLTVVGSEDDAAQVAEPYDIALMNPEGLSLYTLIEDEVLADLPMAPMHDALVDCGQITELRADEASRVDPPGRPFADLAALMSEAAKRRADG